MQRATSVRTTKVVLIGADGETVSAWVENTFHEKGVEFAGHECIRGEALVHRAGDAEVLWFFSGTSRWLDAATLRLLERSMAIVKTGSGTASTDNVPLPGLRIVVANTPGALSEGVSDPSATRRNQ